MVICVLWLTGCASPALGPAMIGKLTPQLDFHDNKFPILTVDFNGETYSLEGYQITPSAHQPSPYVTHFNALLFWDDVDYTCHERGQQHLVCFDAKGRNFGDYAALISRAGPMVGLEMQRTPLLSDQLGTLTPQLHHVDGKFPLLTVYFQGNEYTLEGLYTSPGMDDLQAQRTFQQAAAFMADQTFLFDTNHSWHLTCFNENGENIAEFLKPSI